MAYNNRADNVQKNPERVRRLMRSCARNQGSQVPNTVLAQDIAANDETQNNEETVSSYQSWRKAPAFRHGDITHTLLPRKEILRGLH